MYLLRDVHYKDTSFNKQQQQKINREDLLDRCKNYLNLIQINFDNDIIDDASYLDMCANNNKGE